jgi:hypothetical protein
VIISFHTDITSTGMQEKAFNKMGHEPSVLGEKGKKRKKED